MGSLKSVFHNAKTASLFGRALVLRQCLARTSFQLGVAKNILLKVAIKFDDVKHYYYYSG